MKNYLKIMSVFAMATGLILGSTTVWAEETAEIGDVQEETTQEGYIEEGDGWKSVVTWTKNGDKNIYGEVYYPENYEEGQKYPTIIMSHGLSVTHEIYEKAGWAQLMAQQGYVCYIYDFCGGAPNSLSDLEFTEMSVMTEKSDLDAVMDFVKEQEFCDADQLYLMGQSQGGLVTVLQAADRADEVAGMILLYPAFTIPDNVRAQFASAEEIPDGTFEMAKAELGRQYAEDVYELNVMETIGKYKGDVLIIHGLNDQTIPYSASVDAIAGPYAESASELVLISGKQSVHAFDIFYVEGQKYAHDAAVDYMEKQLEKTETAEE